MCKKITIIGASGHGKVVADIAKKCGYKVIEFLDDDEKLEACGEYPVVGITNKAVNGDIFVAVGNPEIRRRLSKNRKLITLIHPSAVIADDVVVGEGSVIMAGVVINSGTRLGKSVIVNTSSSIDHDCLIGDYCHIAVGAHLCGNVKINDNVWVGAGTTISNNISICKRCTIGAGTVIIHDLKEEGTYIGVPARLMNKKD